MPRPTFIVAEPEPDQALSSRKILLETFKFNVITAHSEPEMFSLLDKFPNVDAVILHDDTPGSATQDMVRAIKKKLPNMQIVALSPDGGDRGRIADHVVNSHKPEELLHLLQSLFGDARKVNGEGKQLPGDAK
jgi:response regulator RpfG family c-di-GMP phosphodiesterase